MRIEQLMRLVLCVLAWTLALPALARPQTAPESSELKLVITVEQQIIPASFPARVTLHLHNSGKETLWLYRRAMAARTAADASRNPFGDSEHPVEGPTLAIKLESADSKVTAQGGGRVLDFVGLPKPKFVRLAGGDDYEEKAVIRLFPASNAADAEEKPVWGRYKFSITYAAQYSNGDDLNRILGVKIWQGSVASNGVDLELQPPGAAAQGTISGTVVNSKNSTILGVLVSLSDQQEKLLSQTRTDQEGKYHFANLPPGTYWITVRRPEATEDTVVFRHLELTTAEPSGTMDFLMPEPETYEPNQMLHKPVLIRVVDSAGTPLRNVALDITWSSGTVLDSVKARTGDEGVAAVELIPGRCYLTLKMGGCPKDDERQDVAPGLGIDGFKMVLDCSKK